MGVKKFNDMMIGPFLLHRDDAAEKFDRLVYSVVDSVVTPEPLTDGPMAVVVLNKGCDAADCFTDKAVFTVYPWSYAYNKHSSKWQYGWETGVKGTQLLEHLLKIEEQHEVYLEALSKKAS